MNRNIFLCILAAIFFGIAPSVMDMALEQGITSQSFVVFGNLFSFVMAITICITGKHSLRIPLKPALCFSAMGILGMGATVYLVTKSYAYIAVGTTTVIHFMYPTIVTVASILFLGKRFTSHTAIAILCSIGGMALISLGSGGGNSNFLVGFLFALASSFTYSFYLVGSELFHTDQYSVWTGLAYMSGASMIVFLIINLVSGSLTLPTSAGLAGLVTLSGLLSSMAYLLLTIGITKVGAVNASFATLIEPVTSVLCGMALLGEKLTTFTILGFVLIFCSLLANFMPEHGEKKAKGEKTECSV